MLGVNGDASIDFLPKHKAQKYTILQSGTIFKQA